MRAWFLPLVVLPFAGCDAGTPLQLVAGNVEAISGSLPAEVRAESEGEVVGTAPIAEDGSFLLALPQGDAIHLALASTGGEVPVVVPAADRTPVPLELRICAPGEETLTLGAIQVGGSCLDCGREDRALRACEHEGGGHDICPGCDDCRELRQVLDRCREEQARECSAGPVARAAPQAVTAIGCAP